MNSLYMNNNKIINKNNSLEWKITKNKIPYLDAVRIMENRVKNIQYNTSSECIWLLEHPSVYTCGTSTINTDILNSASIPVVETKRGGKVTFHGPGQRVVYVMLNLNFRKKDIKLYVRVLEEWCITTLKKLGIDAFSVKDRTGIWVNTNYGESKIGAIGVRVSRWVTYHGISVNINTNLSAYEGINACGLEDFSTTSIQAMGYKIKMSDFDQKLKETFFNFF